MNEIADSKEILKCPACNKKLKKVFIAETGFNVDICLDGCGGIYFDNREISYLDEQNESIDAIVDAIKNKTFLPVKDAIRYCPVCGVKMAKNFVSIKKEVQIDECYTCGGKFFDAGELQAMRAEYKTDEERSADTQRVFEEVYGKEMHNLFKETAELQKKSFFCSFYLCSVFRLIH